MENKTYTITLTIKIEAKSKEESKKIAEEMFKGLEIEKIESLAERRTSRQSNALHLWFRQISDELNANGITAQQIFSQPTEHFWTPAIVKEMWKKVQNAMFNKKSTTQLFKTGEIGKIYDVFNKVIAERAEIIVPPFPSIENMGLEDKKVS